jgi:zinc D-Ala-D-Ala carboxypeptidase
VSMNSGCGNHHVDDPAAPHSRRSRRAIWLAAAGRVSLVALATVILTAGGAAAPPLAYRADAPLAPDPGRATEEARDDLSSLQAYGRRMASLARLEERRTAATKVSRSGKRDEQRAALPRWLRQCVAGDDHPALNHPNGRVSAQELCRLPGTSHALHHDAVTGWWELDRAFARRFGKGLCITDSYRSYEAQTAVYASKPGLAAVPGTSNHGWGIALDLCGGVESYYSEEHSWLRRHGPSFGWDNPSWAREGGSLPEPWHWEYTRNDSGKRP